MQMISITYEVDRKADIELVLNNPNSQQIVPALYFSKGDNDFDDIEFDNPPCVGRYTVLRPIYNNTTSITPINSEVCMRVSSRKLIRVSLMFQAMLQGPWSEAASWPVSIRQINTSEWDATALAIQLLTTTSSARPCMSISETGSMTMKHIKYDVDSGGDAEIVLEGPLNVQGIVPVIPNNHCDYDYDRYNVQSFDNPSLEGRYAVFNVGDTETKEEVIVNVRMRVSSRHLILASSTFRAMLEGPWIENFSHSQSGPAQIMTSNWDPVAQDQSDVVVRRLGLFPRGNHDFDVKDYPQVVQRSRHDAGPPSG
ncbi:hypothetical protein HYE67_008179 [Fusarium culmorum]|uniref:Uncharacterized protein n=1 Tax=Fusarium culmorum TaxID=5516 RepID=A0A7S8HYH8_FUSCU|nr:hypothetical protein HYE67_008179 [Fusarium culmorum]